MVSRLQTVCGIMRQEIGPLTLFLLAVVCGCGRSERSEPVLTPAARPAPAAERAAEAVALTRCDQAERCRVSRYSNPELCVADALTEAYREFDECGMGVSYTVLRGCLAQMESTCAGATGRLTEIDACRAEHVCVE